MVMAGFDPRHLRAYFSSLVKVSERLAGRWGRAADAGAPIDLQADLMRYTVDTVSGLAFGAEVNTLESDDDVIQRHLDKIFPAIFRRIMSPLPTWRYWKTTADRELDDSVAAIGVAIRDFVAAARKRLEDPARRAAPENLLEAMIVAADDPQSGITPGEIHGNVLTMLLAGEDTTANSLAWAIWLLSKHPECLARARAEVDAEVGDPKAWTIERFARLDYVEACANETLRLRPVAPFLMLQALRETSVDGIRIPVETVIWGALRADSLREVHFDEPDRFIEAFVLAGAAMISVHQETVPHLHRTIQLIKQLGARAGVAINPSTPVGTLEEIAGDVDHVLVMSVNPGFGGQTFIPRSESKIQAVRALLDRCGSRAPIEVDGGVDLSNAARLIEAGAMELPPESVFCEPMSVNSWPSAPTLLMPYIGL